MVETAVLTTAHKGLTRLIGNRPPVRTATATTTTDVVVKVIVVEPVAPVAEMAVPIEAAVGIRKEKHPGNSSSLPLRKRKPSKKIIEDLSYFSRCLINCSFPTNQYISTIPWGFGVLGFWGFGVRVWGLAI